MADISRRVVFKEVRHFIRPAGSEALSFNRTVQLVDNGGNFLAEESQDGLTLRLDEHQDLAKALNIGVLYPLLEAKYQLATAPPPPAPEDV